MLINITGIDGCGKTTQIDLLSKKLELYNKPCVISKAYGYKEKALFSGFISEIDQLAIMFLFQALHVQQRLFVEKNLSIGKIVISDRWDDSYIAHHESFGYLSEKTELREELNNIAFKKIKPDVTFLLDIEPQEAIKRMITRGQGFLDKKSIDYFKKIRESFLSQAEKGSWIIIDANKSVEFIHEKITSIINSKVNFI